MEVSSITDKPKTVKYLQWAWTLHLKKRQRKISDDKASPSMKEIDTSRHQLAWCAR
jgi:hypothetical protein